jgi:hypothetical protein
VLRAQAFEGLFTLVPILLIAVISIFLRARASRKRKQREEAARGTPARGVPARGVPARGVPAQAAEGTQPSAATRTEGSGSRPAPARGTPARGAPAQASGRPVPPQQPRRPQVPIRESYAYPPPLTLNDTEYPANAAPQRQGTPVPRPVVRRSAENRMAVDRMAALPDGTGRVLPDGMSRMAVSGKPQDLRERMQARARPVQPAAKAAAGKAYSITARLERLPPLKRAVIWAEILGPPGGRQ